MTAKVQGNIVNPDAAFVFKRIGGGLFGRRSGARPLFGGWPAAGYAFNLGHWCIHRYMRFTCFSGAAKGAMGVVAGIHAQKYDQMSAIANFVITLLAFLSGSFCRSKPCPK